MADSTQTSRQQLIEQCLTDIDPGILEAHDRKCWVCHQVMVPPKNDQDTAAESQKLGLELTAESPEQTIPGTATDESIQSAQDDQDVDGDDLSAVRVACGHTFCRSCISKWLSLAETCPECRHKLFTAPTRALCRWDEWHEDRERIIHEASLIIRDESQPNWLPALRLRDFVMRETSEDEMPSRSMWAMVVVLGNSPATMTNRGLGIAIEHLEQTLSENLDLPEAMRRNLQRVLSALALDIVNHSGLP